MIVSANVSGGDRNITPTYNWSISAGIISSGQGTPVIIIDTAGTVGQSITMEVIIRAVFGITDLARVEELKRVLPRLSSINPVLGLEWVRKDLGPLSPWGRFIRDRDRADRMLYEEIDRRRRDPERESYDDILTLLLSARD